MKKFYSIIMSFVLASLMVFPALASDSNQNINSILTVDNMVIANENEVVFVKDTPVNLTRSGETVYQRDAVAFIPKSPEAAREFIARAYEKGESPMEGTDGSFSVKIYSTFKWASRPGAGGADYFYISSAVTGGYTLLGASGDGTTVKSQSILYAQSGASEITGNVINQNGNTIYPTGSTFRFNVPSNWVAVNDTLGGYIGLTHYVTLQRPNGYTWEYQLTNNRIH